MTANPRIEDPSLSDLVESLALSPPLIARRLDMLGLEPGHRDALRAAAPVVLEEVDTFLDGFYARLVECPATRAWMSNPEQVARLKRQQASYLEALFTAEYDWDHALRCVRIGMIHHRVRLTPQWFMASYGHFVCGHVPALMKLGSTEAEGVELVVTLLKSALADAALALDGYAMALGRTARADAGPSAPVLGATAPPTPRGPAATSRPTVSQVRLGTDEADERAAFLDIDDRTRAQLRSMAPAAERVLPELMEDFYAHIARWEEMAGLVSPEASQRLEKQVSSYWVELFRGEFDRTYAASRTLVGIVHERVGLSAPNYVIGLAHQLAGLLRAAAPEAEDPVLAIQSLLRAAFYDLSFVLQAYVDARAEAVLRSDGFASELLAGLASGVAIVDARERVDAVNPALLTMFGLNPGLVRFSKLSEIIPVPGAVDLMKQLFAGETPRLSVTLDHGRQRFRATAMRLTRHDPVDGASAALVLDDVTDVARAEADLRQTERSYGHVVDAVQALVWEIEAESLTVTLLSRSVLEVTGYRDVALLGRPDGLTRLIPEPDRMSFIRHCRELEPGGHVELQHRLVRAGGDVVWLRSGITRTQIAPGRSVLHGASVDITAAREAEGARLDAVGRLAGGIAHEFNNRFTVILSSLALLDEEPIERPARDLVRDASESGQRCAKLAAQILGFAQRQALIPRPLRLNEVARATVRGFEPRLPSGVQVELRLEPELWRCNLDQTALEDALEALLSNAGAAMPNGGQLWISTRNEPHAHADAPNGEVMIQVTDTGPGMSEAVRQRAFEPFFTTRLDGTGLGLSVVHGFSLQSGGRVSLRSGPTGTAVELAFPRLADGDTQTVPPAFEGRSSVLVVDDEAPLRRVLRRILDPLDLDVAVVGSAGEARRLLETRRVDLLLADVVLGQDESGQDLARYALERNPDLTVILMSGYAPEQLDLDSLGGEASFLAKPFEPAEVRRSVTEALKRSGPAEPA